MKYRLTILVALIGAAAFALVAYAGTQDSSTNQMPRSMAGHTHTAALSDKAADLRVKLDRLLGEHAVLAIAATRKGLDGARDFKTVAATLDRNSVELSRTIASVYGRKAGNQFLNGRFMWRAHVRFFVDYTVATAKKDRAGQRRAVSNLKSYQGAFSAFLAKATNLPQRAVFASISEHVAQLKGQVDAYARGDYARAYRLERTAYAHMFMTGDAIAGAIVKQFPAKFR